MEFLLTIDQGLFRLINQVWVSPWADAFFPWMTDLHKTSPFYFLVFPILLGVFVLKFKRYGFLIFLICLVCLGTSDFLGNSLMKKNFERARPFQNSELNVIQRSPAHGFSFVSNHATNIFAFATFVSILVPQFIIPLFLVAVLVSYSRVYNGVHYPSDVLVGAMFGILIALVFARVTKKILAQIAASRLKSLPKS